MSADAEPTVAEDPPLWKLASTITRHRQKLPLFTSKARLFCLVARLRNGLSHG